MEKTDTHLSKEVVLEILREEFGDWDIEADAGEIIKEDEWQGRDLFHWIAHGVTVVFSQNRDQTLCIHHESQRFWVRRRLKKAMKRCAGIDEVWTYRKVISYWIDERRAKKHEAKFNVLVMSIGIALAIITAILTIRGMEPAWAVSATSAILTGVIWGVYRHGVAYQAPDTRFFAVSILYWLLLHGLPISIILLLLDTVLQSFDPLVNLLHFMVLLATFLTASPMLYKISNVWIQKQIQMAWSEMRFDIVDSEHKAPDDGCHLVRALGRVASLYHARAYGVSFGVGTVVLTILLVQRTWGFIWPIWFVAMVFLLLFLDILWMNGFRVGLEYVRAITDELGPFQMRINNILMVFHHTKIEPSGHD